MTTPTSPSHFAITASTGLDGVTELTSPWSPSPLVRGQPSSTTTQAVVGNISYAKLGGNGAIGSIMVARASAVGVTLSVISDGDVLASYPLLKDWCTPIHIAPTDSLRVVQTVLSPVEVTLCVGNMQGDVFAQYIAAGLTGVSSLALSNAVAETRSQITWAPDGGGDATLRSSRLVQAAPHMFAWSAAAPLIRARSLGLQAPRFFLSMTDRSSSPWGHSPASTPARPSSTCRLVSAEVPDLRRFGRLLVTQALQ